jgi:hypothetical protein
LPVLAGALVLSLALPLFLVAEWPLKAWVAAAVLWLGGQALGLMLGRLKPSSENLVGSTVLAFGMMLRMLAVLVVLLALTVSDESAGLAAALLYGVAYSAELGFSLISYYTQEPTA